MSKKRRKTNDGCLMFLDHQSLIRYWLGWRCGGDIHPIDRLRAYPIATSPVGAFHPDLVSQAADGSYEFCGSPELERLGDAFCKALKAGSRNRANKVFDSIVEYRERYAAHEQEAVTP